MSQVVAKIDLDGADAGIVRVPDAVVGPSPARIASLEAINVVATCPIAALARSRNSGIAAACVPFAAGPSGQKIPKKRDFGPPT